MPRPTVTVRAPAKVNLSLIVGGLRPDGYHALATVFHAVGLYDEVVATEAVEGEGVSLTVVGEDVGGVPLDSTNLAWRAAELLARETGTAPDVHLLIRKGIPVAGGMAGGSADAAAVLVACDHLWGSGLGRDRLIEIGSELGSDVPFSIHGGTCIGTGRGEILTPALARGELHWVLAVADGGLSTPAVYAETDRLRADAILPEPFVPDALMAALASGDAAAVGAAMRNDLQAAAISLRPRLGLTLDIGEEYGALASMVSGSGPTCVFLARDDEHAIDLAVAISGAGVCRTVRRTTGPVPGARVVGESR